MIPSRFSKVFRDVLRKAVTDNVFRRLWKKMALPRERPFAGDQKREGVSRLGKFSTRKQPDSDMFAMKNDLTRVFT
jgi:hypothetical protein